MRRIFFGVGATALVLRLIAMLVVPAAAATLVVAPKNLTVFATATSVPATTCTVTPPGADAYVDEANKGSNFGGAAILDVSSARNANKRSFVRFALSRCSIPAGASIQSAMLRLFITTAPTTATPRTYNAHLAAASPAWTETNITWNTNQPGVLSNPAPSAVAIHSSSRGWLEWTVTTHVAALVNGTATNNGWRVSDANEAPADGPAPPTVGSQFSSKEGANPPALVISYYP